MSEADDLELKKTFVRKQAAFSRLLPEESDMLATLLQENKIKAGVTIVTEGEPVDSVYLIVDGRADVQHVWVKDNEIQIDSLAELGPGDSIGLNERGFYSLSGIRTATVVSKTPMTLFRLSVAAFHGFALAYPRVNEVMRDQAKTILLNVEDK